MKILYLESNSWVIKRDDIRDDMGAAPAPGLTAQCLLSEEPDGAAIHASLEVIGVAIVAGALRAPISGANIETHLEPLLAAAELAGDQLDIYDRVIIAGSYSDYERVRVVRERPAGLP